jgi:VWFA-related protein
MLRARFWLSFVTLSSVLAAQDGSLFRADARLAVTSFRVSHGDHLVEGLRPEDVLLLEDGVPQKITLFESRAAASQVPLDLILLFDTSESVTAWKLLNPKATQQALQPALNTLRTAVYSFHGILNRLTPPTRDPAVLDRAFQSVAHPDEPWEGDTIALTVEPPNYSVRGETWLYEAIIAAARDVATQFPNDTRAMIVISDGVATTTTPPSAAASVANELGMPIFAIALGRDRYRFGSSLWYASQDFLSVGHLTGGKAFDTHVSPQMVRKILDTVTQEMRGEYVVGFEPASSAGSTRSHRVEIRLKNPSAGKVVGGFRTVVH